MATPVTGDGKIPAPTTPQAPVNPLPAEWLGSPEASDYQKPAQYWQRVQAVHGGQFTPEQASYVQNAISQGIAPGATFTNPSTPSGVSNGGVVSGAGALFNVPTPQVGIPSNPNAQLPPSYSGTNYTQFVAPNHDASNQAQLDLVNKILANPDTQSPEVIAKMKQASMEEGLKMAQQVKEQNALDAISRGFNAQGGSAVNADRLLKENLISNILNKNRDIEIGAASQNRADELAALAGSEGILSGQVGRAGDVYNNILKGQTTQAADREAVAQDAISRAISQFGADLQGANFNLNQQQANRSDFRQGQSLDLQRELGIGGLNLDQSRLGEQGREFDLSNALNVLQFLEGARQANNNLGFNYTALNANQNSALMNTIFNLVNGGR
jgi:hypothetical protein